MRLFAEDQDDFGLEDDLMALCFLETGATWRPAKPWDNTGAAEGHRKEAGDSAEQDARVDTVEALPRGARAALDQMLRMTMKKVTTTTTTATVMSWKIDEMIESVDDSFIIGCLVSV